MKKVSTIIANKKKYDSYFDNTLKNSVIHRLKTLSLGIVTLGLAYPWILCMEQEAKCEHTVICGKRLKFIGDPKELIGHWILWWFLIIITFGVFSLVVGIRFQQWVTANTVFEDTVIK
ncbi:hypothetical protein [Clostridium tarantellae]|uniref:DUF898 family protein n=1 Tax=Clostridium tarantellae TaxID=39493 RepID=A0A6I1MRQ3_9CLOT|nr:hypothetical protein [Clostridium tarantellae]MPQ44872.1 hypothetical protein [Clostridium tarantellae]